MCAVRRVLGTIVQCIARANNRRRKIEGKSNYSSKQVKLLIGITASVQFIVGSFVTSMDTIRTASASNLENKWLCHTRTQRTRTRTENDKIKWMTSTALMKTNSIQSTVLISQTNFYYRFSFLAISECEYAFPRHSPPPAYSTVLFCLSHAPYARVSVCCVVWVYVDEIAWTWFHRHKHPQRAPHSLAYVRHK